MFGQYIRTVSVFLYDGDGDHKIDKNEGPQNQEIKDALTSTHSQNLYVRQLLRWFPSLFISVRLLHVIWCSAHIKTKPWICNNKRRKQHAVETGGAFLCCGVSGTLFIFVNWLMTSIQLINHPSFFLLNLQLPEIDNYP